MKQLAKGTMIVLASIALLLMMVAAFPKPSGDTFVPNQKEPPMAELDEFISEVQYEYHHEEKERDWK